MFISCSFSAPMSDPVTDFLAREQNVLADIEGAPVGIENDTNVAAGDEGTKINVILFLLHTKLSYF